MRGKVDRFISAVGRGRLSAFSGVLGANVLNNAVAFFATLYVARAMGAEIFGRVGIGLSIILLGALCLDFGLSTSILRQYPRLDSSGKRGLVAGAVGLKLLVCIAAWGFAGFAVDLLVRLVPILEGYEALVRYSVISAALLSAWNTLRSIEQARREFGRFRNWTILYAVLRVVAFVVLVVLTPLRPETLVAGLYLLPLTMLVVICSVPVLVASLSSPTESILAVLQKIISYGVWVSVSVIAYALLLRLPQLTLSYFGTAEDVGLYGAVLTFLAVPSMLNQSARVVVFPEVAAIQDDASRARFRRRARELRRAFSIGSVVMTLGLAGLLMVALGSEYAGAIPAMTISVGATLAAIYVGMLNMLLHSHGLPHIEAVVNVGRCVALFLLLLVVPVGVTESAVCYAVVLIGGEVIVARLVRRREVDAEGADVK